MTGLEILPLREDHLDALTELDALCFTDPWTRSGFQAELTNGTAVFFAAVLDGKAVGCAGMHCVCGECYIDKVCVSPLLRRQGVAQALLNALTDWAAAHRAEFITLEVRVSNVPAIALYQKSGFVPVGTRKNFYAQPTEDALLMTKYFA